MKRRSAFYAVIATLIVIDSLLLSRPNLLGKIGLVIYKYFYLKTFPRTLLTVSIVVVAAVLISEIIALLVRNKMLKRSFGIILLLIFIVLFGSVLLQTIISFSAWTYSHTGSWLKYGAYLLPCILMFIFGYQIMNLSVKVEEEIPADSKPL